VALVALQIAGLYRPSMQVDGRSYRLRNGRE